MGATKPVESSSRSAPAIRKVCAVSRARIDHAPTDGPSRLIESGVRAGQDGRGTALERFAAAVGDPAGDISRVRDPVADYDRLWRWSVQENEAFWTALAAFYEIDVTAATTTRESDPARHGGITGVRWFPCAHLNWAEVLLAPRAHAPKPDGDTAVVAVTDDGERDEWSFGELRREVAALRAGLEHLGVGRGDRVVALAANGFPALVAVLATAALGAVWSA